MTHTYRGYSWRNHPRKRGIVVIFNEWGNAVTDCRRKDAPAIIDGAIVDSAQSQARAALQDANKTRLPMTVYRSGTGYGWQHCDSGAPFAHRAADLFVTMLPERWFEVYS